ncbi:hypothetical protein K7N57_000722 [Salmonella enterica]|nr:hypothetical protein [Salmonella enterica]EIA5862139.1 hypothetical protein [Salmonella enterica]EII6656459.1 hypothetical protein [Salmonella enterica]EIK3285311.1 hypothetical protein [Salmonella enterica]
MFSIVLLNDFVLGEMDEEDTTVSEAIDSIYVEYTHDIVFKWNNHETRLDRKGDISEIYNDIILMLKLLSDKNNKKFSISFLSSTFTAIWDFSIDMDMLSIRAKWITVSFLNDRDDEGLYVLNIPVNVFISEWNKLLRIIRDDLIKCGYDESLEGFSYLECIE